MKNRGLVFALALLCAAPAIAGGATDHFGIRNVPARNL
jgi:hypothetical protein